MTTSLRTCLLILISFHWLPQTGRAEMEGQDGDWLWQVPTGRYGYIGWDQLGIYGYTGTDTNITIPSTVQVSVWNGSQYELQTKPVVRISSGNYTSGISRLSGNTSITSITFPVASTFKRIDDYALSECTGLTAIAIPPNVGVIGSGAFYKCTGVTSVSILENVTSIGASAFMGCSGLANIEIPDGVSSLGMLAFGDCTGLVSAHIPSSVTSMGYYTGGGGYRPGGVFDGCSNLENVTIERGADIGTLAFYNCKKLASVVYTGTSTPENPSKIGDSAFSGCSSLTSINLPEGLTSVGASAFYGSAFTSLTIPSSLISWGQSAFAESKNLSTVTFELGLESIGGYSYSGITGYVFSGCSKLTNFSIPSSVTSIGEAAFRGCSSLTSVLIPNSVVAIGGGAFESCTGVTSAAYPSNATTIENTFIGCTSLAHITIPTGVTQIGYAAFNGCSNLSGIILPNGVTSIGIAAFAGCSNLESIVIPAGVASVGYYAFYNCSKLKSAFFLGPAPPSEPYRFDLSPTTIYFLSGASGFTSPTWEGYPCFIAAPYGGVIPNLPINEAHLIGGVSSDGNVRLEAAVTDAPLLWQRQTSPVTLDKESSRILRLGASGTVRMEAGCGALTVGQSAGDGFLTAGGVANTPGTLVLNNTSANDLTVNSIIANNGSGVVGLSKTGSGRAVLTGMNTYSGNTTVSGGTLVLKSTCLSDVSAVTVATGGTLNLDYIGVDIVSSLTISGTAKPNGLYDSTNTSGRITGTGKIQVGPFANFAAWASAIAPGQTGNLDHDNDGMPNGIEYFMGKSGNDFTPNPGIAPDGTVIWPKGAGFVGTYQIQTSTDLSIWTDVTNDPAQVAINPTSVIWTRPETPENRFVRLVISSN